MISQHRNLETDTVENISVVLHSAYGICPRKEDIIQQKITIVQSRNGHGQADLHVSAFMYFIISSLFLT